MHECARLAWLKVEPKSETNDELDTHTAAAVQAVTGSWTGRKPFTVDELEALNREYQRGRQ